MKEIGMDEQIYVKINYDSVLNDPIFPDL